MRPLIVIGATGEKCPPELSELIKNRLHERWPDHVHYAETRETAAALLEQLSPPPVLAYAPGVFGDAVAGSRLSPKLWTEEPQVIITTTGNPESLHNTDDPRQFVEGAMLMLKCNLLLNIEIDAALDVLGSILMHDTEVPAF